MATTTDKSGAAACFVWPDDAVLDDSRPSIDPARRRTPAPSDVVFGKPSLEPGKSRPGVREALDRTKPMLQAAVDARAEAMFYKSVRMAPLGHGFYHGATVPDWVKRGDVALGAPSKTGDTVTVADLMCEPLPRCGQAKSDDIGRSVHWEMREQGPAADAYGVDGGARPAAGICMRDAAELSKPRVANLAQLMGFNDAAELEAPQT